MGTRRGTRACAAVLAVAAAAATLAAGACSPGSLPGSPSPILTGGGGGRYSGSITYRRLGGGFQVNEAAQSMTMSLVLSAADQLAAQFESEGGSQGTMQGRVSGALNDGTFLATILVSLPAETPALAALSANLFRPRAAVSCEGRGEADGRLSGPSVTWSIERVTYDNCAGLVTTLEAQATAQSPIPQAGSRATVVLTVLPSTTVSGRGRCESGAEGFPFTVEVAETSGIGFTFDDTIVVEERRAGQTITRRIDNPLTTLRPGEKRRHSACSPFAGTYQAFLTGRDANGHALRFLSPVVTFGS